MWDNKKSSGITRYKSLLSVIDECSDNYIYVYDLTNDIYTISAQAVEVFALKERTFTNAAAVLKEVIYPADYPMLSKDIEQIKNGTQCEHNLEYRWMDKNGRPVWINCRGKVIYDEEEKSLFLIGSIADIGKLSKYDNITSLYSESTLEKEYQRLQNSCGGWGYMLLIGVDNFKGINEKYGIRTGDGVLADIAECIKQCTHDSKCIFRLKGDEFAILRFCGAKTAAEDAKELYKQIRSSVDECIEQKAYQIFYTISGGACGFDMASDSMDSVMRNLRFALHNAKLKGKNTFVAYSEENYQNYIRKMDIQENLRRSITHGFEGFEVYYQPIMDLEHNKIYGAEALIRWNSPKYGFMSPVEFIPLLEESSLIIPLGKWIIEQAVVQCKEWKKAVPDFIMNINLSFVQIIKSDILKDAMEFVDEHGVEHRHIVFEVTESGELENNSAVRHVLQAFNQNGFRLAIDDFGTGYSNLKYIREMMFHIIKIDRLFVKNIDASPDNFTLVKYIVDMAHTLNLRVCVEGVETEAELSKIKTLAPDCIQGFYYGCPIRAEEFTQKHIHQMKDAV